MKYSVLTIVAAVFSMSSAIAGGLDGGTATDPGAIAIGGGSSATQNNALAAGLGANATAENSTVVGSSSVASATNTVAIGSSAHAHSANSTAIGANSNASGGGGSGNVAVGYDARIGVLSPNPRNFRHPRSRSATSASRSIILPSLWKV